MRKSVRHFLNVKSSPKTVCGKPTKNIWFTSSPNDPKNPVTCKTCVSHLINLHRTLQPKIGESGRISFFSALTLMEQSAKYHGITVRKARESAENGGLLLRDGSKLVAVKHGSICWFHHYTY
jgi:hypothetical protein